MRRRVPGARRAGQNGAENDDVVARDLAGGGSFSSCAPRPLPRPSHLTSGSRGRTRSGATRRRASRHLDVGGLVVDGSSTLLGRYGSDTVSDALVAGWGLREISSILRWALADLALALREVERRLARDADATTTAGGSESCLPARN